MSSGAGPSTLVFPSGIDSFSTKIDRNVVISGEAHTIPLTPAYTLFLDYVPLGANPSTVSIPGYTEFSGTPATFQFNVTYSGANAGLITFNSLQSGLSIAVGYTTYGDVLQAEYVNSLQTAVENVESFVLANIASGNFVAVSGGSMNGSLTMNADIVMASGNVTTFVSGNGTIGENATPFANLFVDEIQTNYVHSASPLTIAAIAGDLTLSGDTIYASADFVPTESGVFNIGSEALPWNQIFAQVLGSNLVLASGVALLAATSGTNDIGSTSFSFGTIYADNIVSEGLASGLSGVFVHLSGDTMAGSLVISSGNFLDVYTVINNNGDLLLSSIGTVNTSNDFVPTISGSLNLGSSNNPFDTIYVNNIAGGLLSGNFVSLNGDTMLGDLTLPLGIALNVAQINSSNPSGTINIDASQIYIDALTNLGITVGGSQKFEIGTNGIYISTDIIPTQSGAYNIGDATRPLANVYSDVLQFGIIASGVGISGANFLGDATIASGASIIPEVSGQSNLGSPTSFFGTIYADAVITSASSGTYVNKYGDTMLGDLATNASGTYSIGSPSIPFSGIWADNIEQGFVHKSGDTMTGTLNLASISGDQITIMTGNGPLILDGNTEVQVLINGGPKLTMSPSGTLSFDNIYPETSGAHSLGTPSIPWGTIYADSIVTSIGTSGTFVSKFGDTMTGNLQMASGANILVIDSGTNSIGVNGTPWGDLFVDNINGTPFSAIMSGSFVHISGDTMTGTLQLSSGNVVLNNGNVTLDNGSVAVSNGGIYSSGTISAGTGMISLGNILIDASAYLQTSTILSAGAGIHINDSNGLGGIVTIQTAGDGSGSPGTISLAAGAGSGTSGIISFFSTGGGSFTVSGTDVTVSSMNIIPATSGTHDLGSASLPWNTIYANEIVGVSGSSLYVLKSGDTMNGNLIFASGAGITATQDLTLTAGSGVLQLVGGAGRIGISGSGVDLTNTSVTRTNITSLGGGVGISGNGLDLYNTGASRINMASTGGVIGISGAGINILETSSVGINIDAGSGSANLFLKASAAGDIIISGTSAAGFRKVKIYAGSATGNIIETSGNIAPVASGTNDIGTAALQYNNLWVNNINGQAVPRFKFNEVPTGAIDGANNNYALLNIPLSNSVQAFYNGTYMIPSGISAPFFDYTVISGNTLSFTTAPVSGSTIVVAQYTY